MTFELAPRQKIATRLLGKQRHTLLAGGSRSMKTFTICRAIMHRAMKGEGSKHGIFRFRANAARASISLDTLPKVQRLCYPNVPMVEHRQDGFWQLPNRSQIWVGGLDDDDRTEKILGNEFSTLFLNECSQIPYSSALIALTRLAENSGLVQRAYYDLNPVGKGHWTNSLFGDKKEPRSRQPLPNPEAYARMFMNPRDNPYLSPEYLQSLEALPERQRKRFYEGVYVDEVEGALWTYEIIEVCRIEASELDALLRTMTRVVVAVDPSGAADTDNENNDEIGIVVAGLGENNHGYLIADCSICAGPNKWGKAAVNAYHTYHADAIVAESNFGGEMVRFVINTADKNVPVRLVNASRGKTVRAEPISSLYEKKVVHHVGRFPALEDQMTAWSTGGYLGEGSPDRADAAVWALTSLMLKLDGGANLIEHYRNEFDARRTPAQLLVAEQPKLMTVAEAMQAEVAAQAAKKTALPTPVARRTGRKRKGAEPDGTATPASYSAPVRLSSFYDAAEAQGKEGADPINTQKPAIVLHQEGSTIVRYGPQNHKRERKAA